MSSYQNTDRLPLCATALLVLVAALLHCTPAMAQARWAVKTNLLYDAVTTISPAAEVKLARKWSLDTSAGINSWEFKNGKQWKTWFVQPEARYWLCDVWDGHFFGLHTFGGQFNMGGIKGLPDFLGTPFSDLADHRYQGWFVGAGIAYGYDWMLSKHWNIEGELGVGWAYTRYDRFRCVGCGKRTDIDRPHNYFGPTKLALNITYIF